MKIPGFFKRNKSAQNDHSTSTQIPNTVQDTESVFSCSPSQTCAEKILDACSTNDIPTLLSLFSNLHITAPHPKIIYPAGSQPQPSDPPRTCEMLLAAVQEQHDATLEFLLEVFPSAQISPGISDAALSHRSIPIWTRLLTHDRIFLNEERDESGRTPFSMACWGSEPALPLLMLEYGADPNVGGFGPLTNLTIAMKEQPLELIREFIRKGAELRGELKNAVFYNRADVVRFLLVSGVAPDEIRDGMAAAVKGGNEVIEEILKK